MSSLVGAKSVVQDNLRLYIDLGNIRSYPGTGSIWYDLSNYTTNGTAVNNPSFSSNSVLFNGINNYIQFPTTNFGSTFTFTFWIRPTYNSTTSQMMIANSANGAAANGFRFFINTWNTNDKKIYLEMGTGTAGQALATNADAIVYDTWQQVVIVVNKTINTIRVYVNGVLGTESTSMTLNFNTSNTFRLGSGGTGAYYYKGRFALFQCYLSELTSDQILQNFNSSKGRFGL